MEQNPTHPQLPTEPTKPTAEPALCGACQHPLPCPLHDKPAIDLSDEAPKTKALIEDAPMPREVEKFDIDRPRTIEELHERIRAHREPKPEPPRPVPTERQQKQIDDEMAAGKRASERAAAQQALARPRATEPTDGTSTPVFRPGDVDEYRGSFKSQVQTPSKDAR